MLALGCAGTALSCTAWRIRLTCAYNHAAVHAAQVLTYSLARPAREVLFTVVTREEKYAAKIVIDTVVQVCCPVWQCMLHWPLPCCAPLVIAFISIIPHLALTRSMQRCGDVLAAVAFQTLDAALGMGPSGVAAAAVPLCAAWAAVAHALGQRQEALAARAAQKQQEAGGSYSP